MTDPKRPDDTEELQPTDSDALEDTALFETAAEADTVADAADDTELTTAEREEVEEALEAEYVAEQEAAAPAVVADTKPVASRDRAGRITTTPAAAVVDELPYVDDRVSKVWVALIAAVFALILVYGFLFGKGGFLTPTLPPEPTDSPVPSLSVSPSPSRTPAVSGTPGASGSPTASPSVGPRQTVAPSSTPAPTGTPTAGPT